MTYEIAFFLIHIPIVPAWVLLIFAPRSRLTRQVVHSGLLPVLLSGIYAGFLTAGLLGWGAEGAGMSHLGAVKALFSHPVGLLTGWVHFIVFDLFVGAWIGRDALRLVIPHWVTVICLLFALMFGPIGLALYIMFRKFSGRAGWSLFDCDPSIDDGKRHDA